MSRVAELAREEADRAEAEEDETGEGETTTETDENEEGEAAEDEEGGADESAATQPEPYAHVGEKELQKANRAIEAQRTRLAGILGDAAVAHECLLCGGVGALPELPPLGASMTLVEDEGVLSLAFEPPADAKQYPKAKDKAPCDWCEAEGMVDTGSKNPHARVMPCSKCSGNGWVTVPVAEPAPALPSTPAVAPVQASVGNGMEGVVDSWGRPWGHQHFGVPPAQITG